MYNYFLLPFPSLPLLLMVVLLMVSNHCILFTDHSYSVIRLLGCNVGNLNKGEYSIGFEVPVYRTGLVSVITSFNSLQFATYSLL